MFKKGQSGNPGGRPKGQDYLTNVIKNVYGSPGSIMECEVRERFRILNETNHWYEVVFSQEGFPDFLLEKDGNVYRVEVETVSRNFYRHKHDITQCDMIVCWKNDWIDCPVPVIEIAVEWANYKQRARVKPWKVISEQGEN